MYRDHEIRATGFLPVVVDRGDVRMLQGRDDLRVTVESLDESGVGGDLLVEHLHRDVPPDTRLDTPEHDAMRSRFDSSSRSR